MDYTFSSLMACLVSSISTIAHQMLMQGSHTQHVWQVSFHCYLQDRRNQPGDKAKGGTAEHQAEEHDHSFRPSLLPVYMGCVSALGLHEHLSMALYTKLTECPILRVL